MTRLIDADDLYKLFLEMHKQGNTCDPQDVLKAITNAPTIEADSGEAVAIAMLRNDGTYGISWKQKLDFHANGKYQSIPLYTSPKKRDWVELTDAQWMNIVNHQQAYHGWNIEDAVHHAVKATQAKLKEVNHG